MPRSRFAALLLSAALALPAAADPVADAQTIVNANVTPEAVAGIVSAMQPLMVGAMESEFRKLGIELSDSETFARILMEEFMEGYVQEMRTALVGVYLDEFTPDELAGIAAFFRSPAGQAMASKTPVLAQRGAAVGTAAGQKAGLAVADRVAARLRAEGVTITVDPSRQDQLLDLLDQMGRGN